MVNGQKAKELTMHVITTKNLDDVGYLQEEKTGPSSSARNSPDRGPQIGETGRDKPMALLWR